MKRVICILLALSMLLTGCEQTAEKEEPTTETMAETEVFVEEEPQLSIYEEDAQYLVELVENTHPCFTLNNVPEDYDDVKNEYLGRVKLIDTAALFYEASSKYVRSLKDGHTSLYQEGVVDQHILQVSWYYDGENLYLCDKNNVPTDKKVTKVGDIDIQHIFDTISCYQAMENGSAVKRIYRSSSRSAHYLQLAGMKCDFDHMVTLTLDGGDTVDVGWTLNHSSSNDEELRYQSNISWKMIDDVFYIDQNLCSMEDPDLEPTCTALKDAIANSTTKVIYDVRSNPGGNSNACYAILQSMGMIPPTMGTTIRISELAKQTYPDLYASYRGTATIVSSSGSMTSKKNDQVELIALSDEATYSSANMLCVWVQDGGLGQIVGQGSSNSPSAYGDILYFELPNTQLKGQISHKQVTRPDTNADQK